MDIGKNIRSRRKELNMTLEQLALEIGSDSGNLSRIERGQQALTTDKISMIAKALNCLPADLISPKSDQQFPLPVGYLRIPLLNKLQILEWDKLQNHIEHLDIGEWLITDANISKLSFSFQINDLSMYPEFKEGDKIIIDPTLQAKAGDFVLSIDGVENLVFRKYRARGSIDGKTSFELYPINEDYEIFHSVKSDIKILGVMVEHRKYHRK